MGLNRIAPGCWQIKIYFSKKYYFWDLGSRFSPAIAAGYNSGRSTVTRSLRTRDPIAAIASSSAKLVTAQY
ncbi:hypothetical protein QUB08_12110 [Microcoleus sp. BR0-C5]|uniref:hypothetical protein n=1 Tax=Microcoleus sp. BR0-C5 TaxID=2818713 RepID=UPI002FD3BA90